MHRHQSRKCTAWSSLKLVYCLMLSLKKAPVKSFIYMKRSSFIPLVICRVKTAEALPFYHTRILQEYVYYRSFMNYKNAALLIGRWCCLRFSAAQFPQIVVFKPNLTCKTWHFQEFVTLAFWYFASNLLIHIDDNDVYWSWQGTPSSEPCAPVFLLHLEHTV